MTHSGIELRKAHLLALDGTIGHIEDLYVDDEKWQVRYLVADTRNWLPGRQVLIHPQSVEWARSQPGKLAVNLTREQIRKAPGIEQDQPVSLQHQAELAAYYAWPLPYEGMAPITAGLPVTPIPEPPPEGAPSEPQGDPHLRSLREMRRYRVLEGEREIGHVTDIELDDELRVLALVCGDVRKPPENVLEIDWSAQTVRVKA